MQLLQSGFIARTLNPDPMPDRLLLRLHADGALTWIAQDGTGRVLSGSRRGMPPAETLARSRSITVLVPSEPVVLLDTPLVSRQRAQLLKAVPFALEDQLASPVEDLHFAFPEQPGGQRVAVAVVARSVLQGWLSRLAEDGIRPDHLIPETLALPVVENTSTLLIETSRALLRSGATQASACNFLDLPMWLQACAPAQLEIFDFRPAAALALPTPVTRYHERQRDVLAFFAQQLVTPPALNLLQGEFASAHRHAPAQRVWRNAALLAAAALLLLFVYSIGDYFKLRHESARLDAAMRTALHDGFPEMDKLAGADSAIDARALMQSAVTRLRGGADAGGLLRVLNQIAPVLGSATRVTVRGLEYHNATLELALRAPDVATLDLVREQLANNGLKVDLTAANAVDAGIDGRLRITGGQP